MTINDRKRWVLRNCAVCLPAMKPKRVGLAITAGCIEYENPERVEELKERFVVWHKAFDDWNLICKHIPELVKELHDAMSEDRPMHGIPGKTPVRIDSISYLAPAMLPTLQGRKILEDKIEDGYRIIRTRHSELKMRLRLPEEASYIDCLGFQLTPRENEMRKLAISKSAEFMETRMNIGRPARMHGEYFVPGCNPGQMVDKTVWLSQGSAIEYGKSFGHNITSPLKTGKIKRREFSRRGVRVIYEYSLDSIHEYLRSIGITTEACCPDETGSAQ